MSRPLAIILKLSVTLSTCAAFAPSSAAPPVEGTVSIETAGDVSRPGLVSASAESVGKVLTDKGMTVLDGAGHGRFVVEVRLSRADVGTAPVAVKKGKGVSVRPGMEAMGQGAGGLLNITLPSSKSKMAALQEIKVEIRIRKRDEADALWQAQALTVRAADARNGGDAAVASDLVAAMFSGYPAQPEAVIGVP